MSFGGKHKGVKTILLLHAYKDSVNTVYSPSSREQLLIWRLVSSLYLLSLLERLTKESSKEK